MDDFRGKPLLYMSAIGANRRHEPDVRFYKSVRNFSDAKKEKRRIEQSIEQDPHRVVVIYRVAYDGESFFSARQFDVENGDGLEKFGGEPAGLEPLAYDLISSPKQLADIEPEELSQQLRRIYDLSQQGPPGHLRP